ncbi:MAG: hypothetical protein HQ485_11070 [Acidobacteria bacterium]|nr:hypothetical protein [Acidobacteriota bacterium]
MLQLTRIAAALVSRYPQAWRDRYGDEVLELIEASPLRLSDVSELARGLVVERVRELIESDEHPDRTARILGWMQPAFVMTFMCVTWGIGLGLRGWAGAPSELLTDAGAVTLIVAAVGVMTTDVVLWWRLRRARRSGADPLPSQFPAWAGVALLPLLMVWTAFAVWGDFEGFVGASNPGSYYWFRVYTHIWIPLTLVGRLSSSFWPGRSMLQALARVTNARSGLDVARRSVESCTVWIARGVSSPLGAAEAEVEHWTQELDDARKHLHKIGYRARFERRDGTDA